jgi:glycosyltransferase involved in cell wall biosynthesis
VSAGAVEIASQQHVATEEPVSVLFIIDQLCELGGAERVLLRIIDRLPRNKYRPVLVTFKIDESLGIADSVSCPMYVFPLGRTYNYNAFLVARKLRELVVKYRVQITHTFHETADLWAGPIARMSGCPILISSRRDMGFQRTAMHRMAYRLFRRFFSQVQTVSDRVRDKNIREDGLYESQVVTIHNGVDLPTSCLRSGKSELRRRFGLEQASYVVASVGHIRHIKGFDVLIQAAAEVRKHFPDIVFAIAGEEHEPEHANHLRETVAALGLERNVVLLGGVADVDDFLRCSDIFCLLSRSEGLSNALLEAMACGLPCIATDVGGNPELVLPCETGFLVSTEDAHGAAAYIINLLRAPLRARAMGVAARKVFEDRFTTESMMRRLTDSYEQLLLAARCRNS